MCSGKTTLGRVLAARLGMRFIDLDQAIEERAGMSVSEIFRTSGEDRFRSLEAEMIGEMCSLTDSIIATGGGTPCRPGMMQRMNAAGPVSYTPLRAHETKANLVCRLLLCKKKYNINLSLSYAISSVLPIQYVAV